MSYALVRSKRRTMALQIQPDGTLLVRAPHSARESSILGFIREHAEWIERTTRRVLRRAELAGPPAYGPEDIPRLKADALRIAEERCRVFAGRMGVSYRSIGLSNARSRWGSCSAGGRLRFNWRLAVAPSDIIDYVVVHELAHLKQLNHSERFWAVVASVYPDFRRAKKWLRDNALRLHH